jgi:hypothetical protein
MASPLADVAAAAVRDVLVALAEDPVALGALCKIRNALTGPPAAVEDPSRLISKSELAEKLSVSTSTLDRLCAQGLAGSGQWPFAGPSEGQRSDAAPEDDEGEQTPSGGTS